MINKNRASSFERLYIQTPGKAYSFLYNSGGYDIYGHSNTYIYKIKPSIKNRFMVESIACRQISDNKIIFIDDGCRKNINELIINKYFNKGF